MHTQESPEQPLTDAGNDTLFKQTSTANTAETGTLKEVEREGEGGKHLSAMTKTPHHLSDALTVPVLASNVTFD